MEPNQDPLSLPQSPQAPSPLRGSNARWLLLGAGVMIFLAILVVLSLLAKSNSNNAANSGPFQLVSTNPKLNAVTPVTPFIKVTFNKNLAAGPTFQAPAGLIKSTSVSGSTLTINLFTPLKTNTFYQLVISTVHDTAGDELTNQNLDFKTQPLPTSPLPSDQTQAITQQQAEAQAAAPYSSSDLVFTGTQPLIDNGATNAQVENMEYAFYLYAKKTNQKIYNVSLSNVVAAQRDPSSTSTTFSQTFDVQMDGSNAYSGTVSYDGLLDPSRLVLVDPTGHQVYDSGQVAQYTGQ